MATILFLLCLAAAFFIYRADVARRAVREGSLARYERLERGRMPSVIADGRLILSETYHRTDIPRRLGARFDQVFLGTDGLLYVVDTKRRGRRAVYGYDQIELSVQAAVLRHGRVPGADAPVAPFGWIRLVCQGSVSYERVRLLDDEALAQLHARYFAVLRGQVQPCGPSSPGVCRKCAFMSRCETGKRIVATGRRRAA
ncbi:MULTISPECIES: hypothetical protein [unclassified Rhodanobacter]|uniref:hypothetical protein n=1 Tax=unclassified Rhodanobacter TaxID=2621553 RepID=UPI0007A9FA19|nr:hypothetical protein [Rhodanobacter sp. FW510-R10]KZC32642.1 hypothetical protein RhoFW510R10_12065 [Rhodanobacter sp. FW510-R10]